MFNVIKPCRQQLLLTFPVVLPCVKIATHSYFFLQPVYQDVLQHEPTAKHVLKAARAILEDEEPSEEHDKFEKTVDDIDRRWNNVEEPVVKRQAQIQRIMPNANLYSTELDNINPWLGDAEKKLVALPVLSANPKDLNQRKRDLQVRNTK